MLTLFPNILFLAPAGIALTRVVVALFLIYSAWYILGNENQIRATKIWLVGNLPAPLVWLGAGIYAVLGALMLVGAWTQAVALLSLIGFLKGLLFARQYRAIMPFPRSTYILLVTATLLLTVSGAGAFAFDLPL